jgi:hypothetical protein
MSDGNDTSGAAFGTPPPRVARRNQGLECGILIGHLNIKLTNSQMEFIAIHCTQPRHHRDECLFAGVELVISRRRREDGGNASLILPGNHD